MYKQFIDWLRFYVLMRCGQGEVTWRQSPTINWGGGGGRDLMENKVAEAIHEGVGVESKIYGIKAGRKIPFSLSPLFT